jgi:hypothetical protein
MRWGGFRRSDNVDDRRGAGGFGGGGLGRGLLGLIFSRLGIGGIVAVFGIGWLFGINPIQMLGLLSGGGVAPTEQQASRPPPADDPQAEFVRAILGETEDVWGAIFQTAGQTYEVPRLTLFSGQIDSACGYASAAVGPFYCPGDHRVYLDLSFFREMTARLGGGGEFADAYVVAHEVGHHVQTLLGVSERVNQTRLRGGKTKGAEGLSVRQELQADCFAGVWANHAQARHPDMIQPGDVEQALSTATAIGDDRLQKQSQGTVVPDAFTHGSSKQRVHWFRQGLEFGDVNRCDTFAAKSL